MRDSLLCDKHWYVATNSDTEDQLTIKQTLEILWSHNWTTRNHLKFLSCFTFILSTVSPKNKTRCIINCSYFPLGALVFYVTCFIVQIKFYESGSKFYLVLRKKYQTLVFIYFVLGQGLVMSVVQPASNLWPSCLPFCSWEYRCVIHLASLFF
jgi:hypothetical protein